MAVEIIMPKLGLNMTEGTLVRWLLTDGAEVSKGQILYELETDKVTQEVEADADGILRRTVEEGAVVPVAGLVGYILQPGESAPDDGAPQTATAPAAAAPIEQTAAATPATPPAPAAAASPAAKRRAKELGVDIALVPASGNMISVADVDAYAASQAQPTAAEPAPATATQAVVGVSPVARRIAQAEGVDLAQVQGTGPGGSITREDVMRVVTAKGTSQASPQASETTTPIKGVRAVIFERMHAGAQETAPVTLTTEVDATALKALRTSINEQVAASWGSKVSFNELIMVASAIALREHPYMNAQLTDEGIVQLPDINIGLAVDATRGLLVPVVRDVPGKSLRLINRDLAGLVERALANRSLPDDFAEGTFTITNLGAFGIDAFTPIINLPQVSILGVGRITPKVIPHNGDILVRDRVALSLTFDHRLVDGAPAARFLQRIGTLIEAAGALPISLE